jgi:type IV secretion system protein VirB6
MPSCPTLSPDGDFLREVLTYVNCQSQAIGESGYAALAAPHSSASLILTGLLTIFIAVYGYRMILGGIPTARDAILGVVKIGLVLTLATSWSAYKPLVYDVVVHGPASLAAEIGGASGLPGAAGGLIDWLQSIDDGFTELNVLGTGQPPSVVIAGAAAGSIGAQNAQQQGAALPQLQMRWDPQREALLIQEARTVYLTSVVAAFASVQLIAGLLLALGPLFVMCLFFDTTRGLFTGWVRGLVGAMIGATATAIIVGVELALLGPWLTAILASRHAQIATPTVPVELFVVSLVFALTLVAALVATAWVAHGFAFPPVLQNATDRVFGAISRDTRQNQGQLVTPSDNVPQATQHSRALSVAKAIETTQRRDSATPFTVSTMTDQNRNPATPQRSGDSVPVIPLGASFRRRVGGRVSAGAGRRDKTI